VATTEVFAGLQKLDRARRIIASLGRSTRPRRNTANLLARHGPQPETAIIGAALLIFTLSMDEIAVSSSDRPRQTRCPLESGDACAAASPRDQRRLHHHLRILAGDNRGLVPSAACDPMAAAEVAAELVERNALQGE